jgi:hypothetical protein
MKPCKTRRHNATADASQRLVPHGWWKPAKDLSEQAVSEQEKGALVYDNPLLVVVREADNANADKGRAKERAARAGVGAAVRSDPLRPTAPMQLRNEARRSTSAAHARCASSPASIAGYCVTGATTIAFRWWRWGDWTASTGTLDGGLGAE